MKKTVFPKLIGWLIFAISLLIYTLTLEPTTSFWDCSEFISCASGLEVGHAPGAPMFMLLGKFFSLFAGGDTSKVAFMVNMVSATASAFTIFFLYWTIVWFVKKWLAKSSINYSGDLKNLAIYGSAALGALSFAFTDTFWFSAVEGEVYATSSMFSAIAFWAITKWEEKSENVDSNKWIVLIFYLLGISVGIHLLNTLTIPAIALVYYFKKYKSSTKGILITLAASFILILIIIFVIVPGLVSMAANFDLFFVNSMNLPVYSGALVFIAGLIITLFLLYKYALKKKKAILKLTILSLTFWSIGYSSFALLVIRSAANPFVDMNNVENLFGLVNYLNREQYPQRPLIYGNNYNSPVTGLNERYTYKLYDGKYLKDKLNPSYEFDKNTLTLFPRMASLEPGHAETYQIWVNVKGRPVEVQQRDGSSKTIMVPTFWENMQFFLKYQVGYMYLRYFMWNFSGRQNDIQGHGGVLNGNWITGYSFIDKSLVGPQDNSLETTDAKKSRSVYFMLPLIIGLIGLVLHFKKDRENFLVNLMLFLLTGIAIVVYLNEIPSTPRERDYAFVGSFYAFSIWIGLGFIAIIESIRFLQKKIIATILVLCILFIASPILLLGQNYSCHDRSGRYTTRDYAVNMLESCDKDAILFTTADNDTYPIWYIQEVEGVRKDIRHILEPFMSVDWYADQFNQHFEGKKDLKFSYRGSDILMEHNLYFPIIEREDSAIDLNVALRFMKSTDPRTMVEAEDNTRYNYLPGKKLFFMVNKTNFIKSCSYCNLKENQIPDSVKFEINKQGLNRDEVFVLDLIAQNNWEKPIYFVSNDMMEQLGLADYLYPEGVLYRLLPFKKGLAPEFARTQALHQYQLIKNKFKWGNVNSKSVYIDQMNVQMVSMLHFRQTFASVAKMLVYANENEKALEILNLEETIFPKEKIPYSYETPQLVDAYFLAGDVSKAEKISREMGTYFEKSLAINLKIDSYFRQNITNMDSGMSLYILQQLIKIAEAHQSNVKVELAAVFNKYYKE